MSREFKCGKCGLYIGEMEKGKFRHGAVVLCAGCWGKAESAMNVAEMAREEMPGFMKDVFGKMGKFDK